MGANAAFDLTGNDAGDDAGGPENDCASELYAAVASMRAHAVRMRAVAQNQNQTQNGEYSSREFSRREPDYSREPDDRREPEYRGEFARPARAPETGNDCRAPAEPAAESPVHDEPSAFYPQRGQLDAAAEHLGRGRLPDLNALAEMMMEMKSAQRAYELNLQMMDATHAMMARTVDLLRR